MLTWQNVKRFLKFLPKAPLLLFWIVISLILSVHDLRKKRKLSEVDPNDWDYL
jgi:hypothetical protein